MSSKGYPTEHKSLKTGKVITTERFNTISGTGYGKYANDVAPKSYYELTPSTQSALSYDESKGVIELAGHAARRGDMIRIMDSGTYNRFELEVLDVDGDFIFVDPRILDHTSIVSFKILRAVSNLTDPDGAITASTGPTQVVIDGAVVQIETDEADVTKNKPMPSRLYISKDGDNVPVNKDTNNPNNTQGIPVEIVSGSGSEINITAGDINVQTSHTGLNPDSMQIGDGTTVLGITVAKEAKVNDDKLNTVVGEKADVVEDDYTKTASLIALTKGVMKSVQGLQMPNGLNLESTQEDVKTAVESIAIKITSLEAKDFATETTLDGVKTAVESIDTKSSDLANIKNRLNVMASGLVPEVYDEIALSYTGEDLTGVVYKLSSSTVATLTLAYSNGKLTGVVKS